MSFFFEGNGFFDGSIVVNSSIGSTLITQSAITKTSLDMLDTYGNFQHITNVKDPLLNQDAATKKYVDDLQIVISNVTLSGTSLSLVSNNDKGSFVITISNLILNGPSAIFHVSKNEATNFAHIVRTVAVPGQSSTNVFLELTWPIGDGLYLSKTGLSFDGTYKVKIM